MQATIIFGNCTQVMVIQNAGNCTQVVGIQSVRNSFDYLRKSRDVAAVDMLQSVVTPALEHVDDIHAL